MLLTHDIQHSTQAGTYLVNLDDSSLEQNYAMLYTQN